MFKSFFTAGLETNISGLITLGIPSYDGLYPSDATDLGFPLSVIGIDRLLFNNILINKYRPITDISYTITIFDRQFIITNIAFQENQNQKDVLISDISYSNQASNQNRIITEIFYG